MAYTTVEKVKSLFRDIAIEADTGDEETNTVITTEEVDEFIARGDEIIDGTLSKFYQVPITGAKSLLVVEEISTLLAAHRIKGILELNNQISDKVQEVQGNLYKQAMELLAMITPTWDAKCCRYIDADIQLSDAVVAPTSGQDSLFNSQNKNLTYTPTFTKGGNNW